jgi:hypothetical protein
MVFSGGGYHFYIFTKNGAGLKDNKMALLNAHNHFCSMLGLALDPHIKGDVARISRILNTYNGKRNRYCIPLSKDDLKAGDAFIREKARSQNFKVNVYGWELLDISKFDSAVPREISRVELTERARKVILGDDLLKELPPCVAKMLQEGKCGWRERYIVISYFRDKGFLINETEELLRKYLSPEKFKHCVQEERQVQYLYARYDLFFPHCERLEMEGFCVKGCKTRDKIYR